MPKFQPGDYVKAEFQDEATGESEWMWVVGGFLRRRGGSPVREA